ncbi:uncharacterized protein [Montipora capricornis]|uniref:uncharacterized protein isoform X2 n=1 Tax=Montipora capricornis TaxID=246305 RepID=UPI0035F13E5C
MAYSNSTPQLSPRNLGNLERYSCENEGCCKVLTNYHTFRECDLHKHKICRHCHMKRYEESEPHSPKCPCCQSPILRLVKPSLDEDLVFIYVDNSNVWIEGKKLAAKQQKLKCLEDPRMRLDIGKVADVVANGRHVVWGVLYGSEPPPIDTVWNIIRTFGWKVVTNKRSTIQNKEKQVDQQLVADIIALVCDKDIAKGKIAVISGDADVIPAIKEGEGWSFEIWMWDSAISTGLKDLADKKPELLTISTLDSHLESISFTNFKFVPSHISSKLSSRAAVIENYDFETNEDWEKGLIEKVRWPFQSCTIGPKTQESAEDFKDLLLVFASNVKSIDGEDFSNHFVEIFEILQKEYPRKVVNFSAYNEKNDIIPKISLSSNIFDTLEDLDDEVGSISISGSQKEGEEPRGQQNRDQERHEEQNEGKPDEDDDRPFQTVERKGKRRQQKYSEQCKDRSYCRLRLNCLSAHTNAEKKFFKNHGKYKLCPNAKSCRYGPKQCWLAHTDKDGYCRKCNKWGHLEQDKCSST